MAAGRILTDAAKLLELARGDNNAINVSRGYCTIVHHLMMMHVR